MRLLLQCCCSFPKKLGLWAGEHNSRRPALTYLTTGSDSRRSQALSSLFVLKQDHGQRRDSTWSSLVRRSSSWRVPVAMDRVEMMKSKMMHTNLSHAVSPCATVQYLLYLLSKLFNMSFCALNLCFEINLNGDRQKHSFSRSLVDVVYALRDEVQELKQASSEFFLLSQKGLWWLKCVFFS